jgi:hypothetical protein
MDYPERMLDDLERKEICLTRMKAAYDAAFRGDAPEVLDGCAGKLLKDKYEGAGLPQRKRQRAAPEPKQKRVEEFLAKKRGP